MRLNKSRHKLSSWPTGKLQTELLRVQYSIEDSNPFGIIDKRFKIALCSELQRRQIMEVANGK